MEAAVESDGGLNVSAWDQLLTRGAPCDHLVQFYGADDSLLVTKVGHYLCEGWRAKEGLIAVGTARHNLAIADQLSALGMDVAAAIDSGRLVFFDADELVEEVAPGGRPDWSRFDASVGATVRHLLAECGGVRAFGEMVGILWTRGQRESAARLEECWNRLMASSPLALFCTYPVDLLDTGLDPQAVDTILSSHTHLLPMGSRVNLEEAVGRAMQEILGNRGPGLRKLVDTHFRPSLAAVPKPEGMVLWLRNNLPQYADQIIDRAREYYKVA